MIQAGAELCQAQVKLEVVVEVEVEFGVEVETCHYKSGWIVVGIGTKKNFGPQKLRPPKNWVPKVWSKSGQ